MISQGKVVICMICAFLLGSVFVAESLQVFRVRNASVVEGRVIARDPVNKLGSPQVDFTIQIEGTDTVVHAVAPRYLMERVPESVRFRYAGDPAREVFLFEHENNPYWLVFTFWGLGVALLFAMQSAYIRRVLGWPGRS